MNFSWLTRAARPIGLDVGSRVIRIAQLDAAGSRLIASARVARTGAGSATLTAEEAALIAGTIARRGFLGSDLALAMPPSKLISAVLDLPPRNSGAPVADIARAEIARIQRLDPESLELGMWDLPGGPRAKAGEAPPSMVVACKRDDAEALLAPLDQVNLTGVRLDVPGACVVQALTASRAPGARVVLDIGASAASSLVLLGHAPIFERRVPDAGLEALFAHLRDNFELDNSGAEHVVNTIGCNVKSTSPGAVDAARQVVNHAELIVRELKTSLAYVAHRSPDLSISEILLIGGGASIPGMETLIASGSGIPTRTPGWADLGVAPGTATGHPPDLTMAIGLARSGAIASKEAA